MLKVLAVAAVALAFNFQLTGQLINIVSTKDRNGHIQSTIQSRVCQT
jgi:hypothetical protein